MLISMRDWMITSGKIQQPDVGLKRKEIDFSDKTLLFPLIRSIEQKNESGDEKSDIRSR